MTPDELEQALIAKGWRISIDSHSNLGVGWYAWLSREDRKTARDCVCNDKPPSFVIRPAHIEMGDGRFYSSVTFDLCGEVPGGRWLKFEAYSVSMGDALATIEPAKRILMAAWDAAWDAAESIDGLTA